MDQEIEDVPKDQGATAPVTKPWLWQPPTGRRLLVVNTLLIFLAVGAVHLLSFVLSSRGFLLENPTVEGLMHAFGVAVITLPVVFLLLYRPLIRSVEESRAAAEALRRSEAKYRDLVENANSIILKMDTEGRVTFFNEYAQQFFGFSEEEILGRSLVGTIVPETDSAGRDLHDMVETIVEDPEPYAENENENMTKDGQRVWVRWRNQAIFDDEGRYAGLQCIGLDATERRKARRERERLIEELQEALADVKTLSGLFPICASCKKIRDDQGYWNQIESYISEHSEAEFSHSICPDCQKRLYPDSEL